MKLAITYASLSQKSKQLKELQKRHKVVKFSLNKGNSEIPIEFTFLNMFSSIRY